MFEQYANRGEKIEKKHYSLMDTLHVLGSRERGGGLTRGIARGCSGAICCSCDACVASCHRCKTAMQRHGHRRKSTQASQLRATCVCPAGGPSWFSGD